MSYIIFADRFVFFFGSKYNY